MSARKQWVQSPQLGRLRLEAGAHDSPDEGVCIVELASILAGERFTDRPICVDEVIAAFLRSWNDRLGHAERQRLVPYADRVVGTNTDAATTRKRRDICLASAAQALGHSGGGRFLGRLTMRARIAWLIGLGPALRLNEGAGELASRLCFRREDGVDRAFELLDQLISAGGSPKPSNGNGNGNGKHQLSEAELAGLIESAERPHEPAERPHEPVA